MKNLTLIYFLLFQTGTLFSVHQKIVPYIQKLKFDSAQIHWESPKNRDSWVVWGEAPDQLNQKLVPISDHIIPLNFRNKLSYVKIEGLQEARKYYYQVREERGERGPVFHFKTLEKDPDTYSFLAMSDAQHGYRVTTKVVRESVLKYGYNEQKDLIPSFVVFAGDLVQNGASHNDWIKQWFQPLAPLLSFPRPGLNLDQAPSNHFNSDL